MTGDADGLLPLEEHLCYALYSTSMAIQRVYKPLLDQLGLTYPQYLVLTILWREDGQTVGSIAEQLALESSTLTPLLKRLEAAKLVQRIRNPLDERQVLVSVTAEGRALRPKTRCLGEALLASSGRSVKQLGELNHAVRQLRDALYDEIGGWNPDGKQQVAPL
jgi:MarR family transcriptional regulator, organic hydroperoxide resistance regulator